MKLTRDKINIRHSVTFSRPSPTLASQGARLLEGLMEELAENYTVTSKDVAIRNAGALDEWAITVSLFNRLGNMKITVDGIECTYTGLTTDGDIAVVVDVQRRLLSALAVQFPTLKTRNEGISGSVVYSVEGGHEERDAYFARVSFPGRSSSHLDVSFKARRRLEGYEMIGAFELAPVWADPSKVLMSFDVDTSQLPITEFPERAALVDRLVAESMASFDLQHTDGATR